MEPAKDKVTKTASGKPIEQTPGSNQELVTRDMPFAQVLELDQAGKQLVFDTLDFPEISPVNLGKLSNPARIAYQMDMRNAHGVQSRTADGSNPYEDRISVIDKADPLARTHGGARVGAAKKLPKGMKHLNVTPDEVSSLEAVGYKKAKPGEVEIVGSSEKSGTVVLKDNKGEVSNVTMLVPAEDYKAHRKAGIAKSEARVNQNLESTKEKMRRYDSRVTVFDKSEMEKKR
jgi:hypothetical protein